MPILAKPDHIIGNWHQAGALGKNPATTVVVIDEAYIDYVREEGYGDSVALTRRYDNVVVSRTFSKIYGLGGLRIDIQTVKHGGVRGRFGHHDQGQISACG